MPMGLEAATFLVTGKRRNARWLVRLAFSDVIHDYRVRLSTHRSKICWFCGLTLPKAMPTPIDG